jgi:hypothetical protein
VQAQQWRPTLAHRAVPDTPAGDVYGPFVRSHTSATDADAPADAPPLKLSG